MPKERVFDASGGVVSTVTTDAGKTIYGQYQDPTAILDNNQRLRTMNDGYNSERDIRRVANIPVVVLQQWCKEAGINVRDYMKNQGHYKEWLRAKIYNSDNAMFLTAPHSKARRKISGLDSVINEGRKIGTA